MSTDYAPPQHIQHLLLKALEKNRATASVKEAYLAKSRSTTNVAYKIDVRDYIEKTFPGIVDRLTGIWGFHGSRALLLWSLPCFKGKHIADITAVHAELKGRNPSAWIEISGAGQKDGQRVRRARVGDDLHLEVWLTKTTQVEYEGEPNEVRRTEKIPARIDFAAADGGTPLVEVYASPQDARAAVLTTLDWLTGVSVSAGRPKDREAFLRPMAFSQAAIVKLMKRLKCGFPTEIDGLDPTAEVGQIKMSGHRKGVDLQELDLNATKVAQQYASQNATHRYKLSYTHEDGFVEHPQATFHFQAAHPRIQFHTRTSRLAMDDIISELRAELGV